MKVTISSVVLAALLGLVDAKVHLTNSDFGDIEAGSTFEITWDEAQGPVTLTLKNGDEDNLDTVETITTGASGDSFVWSVDSTLPTGDYAIEISDGTDMNYSVMFPIAGTTAPSSSSTGVSSTVSITSSTASPTSSSESSSSSVETTTESTSSESTSAESTSTEATSSTSASSSAESTTSTSAVTRTTSSTPSPTQSDASQTTVPNANDALSMAAPIVPGLLALLGAAIL